MQTSTAVEQNKNIKWSESPWNQSGLFVPNGTEDAYLVIFPQAACNRSCSQTFSTWSLTDVRTAQIQYASGIKMKTWPAVQNSTILSVGT